MPSQRWVRIVIALAAAVWAGIVITSGGKLKSSWINALGIAASVVVLLLLAFDRWMWRWPGFHQLLRRPVLHGTWRVEVRTSFEARREEVIRAYVVIRQTYSTVRVNALFDRSRSNSLSADLIVENGVWTLFYIFRSEKGALARDDNPPARGGARLVVALAPHTHLEGDYWTEQGTRGQIASVGYTAKLFDTYSAAEAAAFNL
jgi:SMODS-associating 2TM, beta-strand rich effector domain